HPGRRGRGCRRDPRDRDRGRDRRSHPRAARCGSARRRRDRRGERRRRSPPCDRAAPARVGGTFVSTSDVVVVGGGGIGLASAWRIAQRGSSVTVVDPNPGSGASHAAAGMLCPITEVHYGEEALLALNLESARRWPDFARDVTDATGNDIGYRTEGTL